MAIQYYMRGYNTSAPGTVGYVDWVVNDTPDSTATYVPSPYSSVNIANIVVNRTVTSKVDNFLKPNESLAAIGITGSDGYFFHINSYDWLHTTPPGPPIPVPSHLLGLSMVRGSADGVTPRDYSTLFWSESLGKWLFAYNTNGDGVTIGAALPVGMGSLSIDGYIEVGTNPAHSGIIRIPNNQFIVSRSADGYSDGYLIGQDNLNRVRLGSPPGNEIYIPGDLRVDGYIRDGGAVPATTGFVRNSNGTAIVTFKNLSNVDVTALSSSGNLVVLGDAVNAGVRLNTATGFEHIFQVNTTNIARIGANYFKFESTSQFPSISQFDTGAGNGQDLKFKAQTTTSGGNFGGSAVISSGHGPAADGYVDLRVNDVSKIRVFGAAVPVTADLPVNQANNPNSIQLLNPTIRWYYNIAAPTITQDPDNTNSVIGQTLTVQAQNTTGTGTTGGILQLRSGTGTTADGYVKIQTGITDQIIVSPVNIPALSYTPTTGKVIIRGNLEVLGTTTTIDSTIVDIIGRVIHANWSDPAILANANTPVPSQIAGYTIHRGNSGGVPRDSASLMWTEGVLNSGADGYWRATTYTGDGYGTDGYTIGSGGIASLAIMARNFTVVDPTPNPVAGSLPGIGGLRTQKNTVAVSSRNLTSTLDLILLGTDNSNRIIHGDVNNSSHLFNTSSGSVYDFQVNSTSNKIMIGDGYIRAGANPSTNGIFRNTQTASVSNPIVTSRNFGNTLDMVLLGTDGYDRVVHGGAAVNTGHIFNTSVGSVYDFQVNSVSNKIMVGDGYIRAGASPSTIGVFRNTQTPSVNNPIVASRNFANSLDLALLSTDGYDRVVHGDTSNKAQIFDTAIDGYYDFRANSSSTLLVDGYKVSFQKGRRRHITPVSTTYQVLVTDDYLAIDASTIYTITMPANPVIGDAYEFKDVNGTATINNVTVAGNGKNIDGASTFVMNTNFASFVLTYTGVNWSVS